MPPLIHTFGNRQALFDIYPFSFTKEIPQHRHRFYEIILIRSGSAELSYRGETTRLEANQVHICPPRTPHALRAMSLQFVNASIAFYPRLFRLDPPVRPLHGWPERGANHPLSILAHLSQTPTLDLSLPAMNRLNNLMEVMREEFRLKLPGYERQLSLYAQETLLLFMREQFGISAHTFSPRAGSANPSSVEREPALHQNPHIAKVVRWMKDNTTSRPNLKGYAHILKLDEKYLIALFTQVVGISPQRYHNRLRLEEAARHLINTTLSIEEIARRFAFPSRSHFSKQFHELFHTSPGVYRYSQRQHST